ncbi:MAG TPA: hypothetical protein VN846_01060 [Candidatus Cybelea sp.]|jgi:hypothetical protein|nr:hypothetical protein [Candidatus Cybelea sp.]
MLSLIIWCCGIALEALLVYRGFRAKLLTKYSNFYGYIFVLLVSDGLGLPLYFKNQRLYESWSWFGGFVILFLGCGIILEIFRHVLSAYAGAEKIARFAGFVILGAVLGFAIVYHFFVTDPAAAKALYYRLQRDFLTAQAILLFGLLQVISYYGIRMGRNLKGMILGYGQTLGVTLIALALRAYIGVRFEPTWGLIQQISYVAALTIWLVALWSYCANPEPEATIGPDGDYEALATRTRSMVGAASTELIKVNRL